MTLAASTLERYVAIVEDCSWTVNTTPKKQWEYSENLCEKEPQEKKLDELLQYDNNENWVRNKSHKS